jgi:hypothetical protein
MNGNPGNIQPFEYFYGQDKSLEVAVQSITAPGILVAWLGTHGGNFDGMTIWKHRVGAFVRMANIQGAAQPNGYEYLFYTMFNSPVNGGTVNIRYVNLLPNVDIMDTPTAAMRTDVDRFDYQEIEMVFPEIGDD